MSEKIARCVSVLAHPIFVVTGLLSWLLFDERLQIEGSDNKWKLLALFFVCCGIVILLLLLLRRLKYLSSMLLEKKEDRVWAYGIILFILFLFTVFVAKGNFFLYFLSVALLFCLIILSFCNFLTKISAHLFFWGFALGFLISFARTYSAVNLFVILCFLVGSGVVAWARLKLSAHTSSQVYVGFLLGLTSYLIVFYWLILSQ